MFNKIDHYFAFQQKALALHSYRAQLIASNIANSETPGYKAVDIDFAKTLARHVNNPLSLTMQRTHVSHMPPGQKQDEPKVLYRTPLQPSLDGNTVDMDVERAAFADSSLRFQSTLTFLNRRIASLSAAIQGQTGG